MKSDRKSAFCLNCGHLLAHEENYCPECGQENKDQKVSFSVFLSDFFSNYINFESTFFRTIPVFLLKPGKLTQEFNEGKRRKYLHPIRLYLILSLFYFFAVGLIIPPNLFDHFMSTNFADKNTTSLIRKSLSDSLTDEDERQLDSLIGKENMAKMEAQLQLSDSLDQKRAPSKNQWMELKMAAQDPNIDDSLFGEIFHKTNFVLFSDMDMKIQRNFIANSNLYIINSAQNLPIMMFLLLPFFALLLKILYIGTGTYYVEHLISGLHMHSFAYLLYGLGILFYDFEVVQLSLIVVICFVLVTTYAYVCLLKLHHQGWFVTLMKFWLLGFVYFTVLSTAIGAELYISLLLM